MPAGQPDPQVSTCPFCAIVAGDAPATVLWHRPGVLAIEPLNPHAPGHTLIIPTEHLTDANESPHLTAAMFGFAVQYASRMCGAYNLITSVGDEATQTVFHLHIHVIPRHNRDLLPAKWPWLP